MAKRSRRKVEVLDVIPDGSPAPDPIRQELIPEVGLQLQAWLLSPTQGPWGMAQPPSVTFWCDGTHWRASLHDRGERLVSYLKNQTLAGLLLDIDQALRCGELAWRRSYLAD